MPFAGKGVGDTDQLPVVTSRANARVKQLRAASAEQARLSGGLLGIEGEHLLEEVVRSGITPELVFVSEHRQAPACVPGAVEVIRLSEDVFASAVETRSPQGVAALVTPPVWAIDDMLRAASPLLLVAAGVQDPGNLGTLVRSAEAFGATGVLLTPGTVSVWNGKSMRASAGSVFRVPVVRCDVADLRDLRARGVALLATVGSGSGVWPIREIGEADLARPVGVLVGNEGAGLAEEWLRMADECITIPCPGPVESLNVAVAGSIVLFEASRQRVLRSQERQLP